jgi:hypothetical protein
MQIDLSEMHALPLGVADRTKWQLLTAFSSSYHSPSWLMNDTISQIQ